MFQMEWTMSFLNSRLPPLRVFAERQFGPACESAFEYSWLLWHLQGVEVITENSSREKQRLKGEAEAQGSSRGSREKQRLSVFSYPSGLCLECQRSHFSEFFGVSNCPQVGCLVVLAPGLPWASGTLRELAWKAVQSSPEDVVLQVLALSSGMFAAGFLQVNSLWVPHPDSPPPLMFHHIHEKEKKRSEVFV